MFVIFSPFVFCILFGIIKQISSSSSSLFHEGNTVKYKIWFSLWPYDIPVGFPPGITDTREDCRPRATPSSDNPLSGKLFLVETPQECHICKLSMLKNKGPLFGNKNVMAQSALVRQCSFKHSFIHSYIHTKICLNPSLHVYNMCCPWITRTQSGHTGFEICACIIWCS